MWCVPGTLKFRTLFERSLYDMMFRNQAAVKCVLPPPQSSPAQLAGIPG